MKRTIICLAAKRSGTTAVHRMFVNHPDVGICHPNQAIPNWEPNFWNYAADALGLKSLQDEKAPADQFMEQMSIMAPGVLVQPPFTAEKIFGYWDIILETYGPIIFDKSPKYLHSEGGLKLLYEYIQRGNDVRIFGLVRDPRDAISSQYEHWKDVYAPGTPQYRDAYWVEHYRCFLWFQDLVGKENCPLIRYEDFSTDPKHWGAFIFQHCGVADIPQAYEHVYPVHVGRYYESDQDALVQWKFSQDLINVAAQYGYVIKKTSNTQRIFGRLRKKARFTQKEVLKKMKSLALKALFYVFDRFSVQNLEKLLLDIVMHRVRRLSPPAALQFLFRLDAALYSLQKYSAVIYGDGIHPKHRHMKYHDFFTNRIGKTDRVLDIGCGIGAVAFDVAEKTGAYVVGMDINEENIKIACERFRNPNLEFRVGDALETLPAEGFSTVILSNVLEHLPKRPDFLKRIQQTIHPQRILIRVPLFERDWRVPLKKEVGVEWRLDSTHETEYTLESFDAELHEAGLTKDYLEVRWGEIWAEVSQTK
ncbi:MAG TPA: sulfotransferase [Anaerolineales bacterium]|nr:sulfotransferase [Anaerolineales bacterium]